jgi:hypothetical protein
VFVGVNHDTPADMQAIEPLPSLRRNGDNIQLGGERRQQNRKGTEGITLTKVTFRRILLFISLGSTLSTVSCGHFL